MESPSVQQFQSDSMANSSNVSLKLLVDTKGQRVLFAEAGKDFVDFLFNMLSLPIGTVIRLLTKQNMVGCLSNLYESVENLSDIYVLSENIKDTLLKPRVSSYAADVPLMLPNVQSPTTINFYRCDWKPSHRHGNGRGNISRRHVSVQYSRCNYIANYPTSICPSCKKVMNTPINLVDQPSVSSSSSAANNEKGYVKAVVAYIVMDDLVVCPMSTISSITLLNKFEVKEVGALQERMIDVGMNEGVEILKASLQSKTVLSDVFLKEEAKKKRSKCSFQS